MATTTVQGNTYLVTTKDQNAAYVTAATIKEVADLDKFNNSSEATTPLSIQMDVRRSPVAIIVTKQDLRTFASILPEEAKESGCVATPTTPLQVAEGTFVVFEAVGSNTYSFVNWTRNGKEVSTDSQLYIPVTALEDKEVAAEYVANFAIIPVPPTP